MAESPKSDGHTTAGSIFTLVRRGEAHTRGEIARATGLAPSTVSLRVESLIDSGLLEEASPTDTGAGGRPPRLLRLNPNALAVAAAVLGEQHFALRIADQAGRELSVIRERIDVATGPADVLSTIWFRLTEELSALAIPPSRLSGLALGIPAPVDPKTGMVTTSARLPGWGNLNLYDILRAHTAVPLLLANDANLMATAEFQRADPAPTSMLAVKVGSRIGSGIIVDGQLITGVSGAAGEISHSPTSAESIIQCFCGTANCLESVASGSAIVERLRTIGYRVTTTTEVVDLANTGDPVVLDVLRDSARQVGETIAAFVNFINPSLVTFGGSLAAAETFVATVRGTIFQRCLPVVSASLDIRVGRAGIDPETSGGIRMVLDAVLASESIDRWLTNRTPGSTPTTA